METIQVDGGTFTGFNALRVVERLIELDEKRKNPGVDVKVKARRLPRAVNNAAAPSPEENVA